MGLSFHLVGSGRVYRPAVMRTDDTITCRFNPWREAAFYLVLTGMPALSAAMFTGASAVAGGNVSFARILGILVLTWTPILLLDFWHQRRQSVLRITPVALAVPQPGTQPALTDIPRSSVQEISATAARMRNYDTAPATQITYREEDCGQTPHIVLFGPTNTKKTAWLTVEQADLLAGLHAWKDGDPNDPALMDRVETILRGQTTSAPGGFTNLAF